MKEKIEKRIAELETELREIKRQKDTLNYKHDFQKKVILNESISVIQNTITELKKIICE